MILLITISMIYLLIPKVIIDLEDKKIIDLYIGEKYEEQGANAYYKTLFSKKNLKVKIENNVDESKIGKYVVTYSTTYKHRTKEIVRIVNVLDNVKPEIKLNSKVIGCKSNNLIEYDIVAIDNYDGNITEKLKYELPNEDEIIFVVKDSSNNESTLIEKINYIDHEKPIIALKGSKNITLNVGEPYVEYGATAFDSCDGDLNKSLEIENNVDINTPGIYEVNYSVVDNNNKKSIKKRYVTIVENNDLKNEYQVVNGATIYLTFDDGPGPYTEKILGILKEYGVKATFFVTGQFPKYQDLIKKEYEDGHSIGIHTYSHKWSIYSSLESYLEDFTKIENVIFEETGEHTKLFRFPGGSSNTISRNYSKGIMTKLTDFMENKGYIYFDWTFDSGDTSKTNNSVNDIIKNFKLNLKGDGEYIVLMHDIKENTLKALPEIIKFAQANGYKFAKLTEDSPTEHLKVAN